MARLGDAAAGAAGAEGAAAVAAGLAEPAMMAPVALEADAAVIAADVAPFVEVIETSMDPAPEMPEDAAAAAEDVAIDEAVMAVADNLRDFMEAERLVAAVREGEAASLAEAVRLHKQDLDAAHEWPTLVDARQHSKRRRSTTPAPKPGAAAPPNDPPAADAAPEDPSSGDLVGLDIPCGQLPSGQEIPGEAQAAEFQSVAQAAFEERVLEIMAGEGDAPQAAPLPNPAARSVRFDGAPSPGDAPVAPLPQRPGSANDPPPGQQPAGAGEAIPSKAMPKLPPAGVVMRPSPYTDICYAAPSAPSPEFIAAFDAQMADHMAAERGARFAAAWKSSDMANAPPLQKAAPRPPASGMYSHRQTSPQMAPQMEPHVPLADAVGAFIAWQLAQGDKGKGKYKAPPSLPIPPGMGAQGQGGGPGWRPLRAASAERWPRRVP